MLKTLRFLPLLGGLLLASCSDDDGTEPTPSIAVSLGGAITVVQGQTGTTQVTVTRAGGASSAVALTASGLPANVTATFDPATIPAGTGTGTSTLTLTAGAAAVPGTATFTVTANGGASVTATATGSVTVNAAPDFTLAVAPTTLTVEQGAAGTANITITRTGGLTGAVNLTVSNLPVGVTAAFDNAAPTGNTAVLTLTVGAVAALTTTNLAVNGAGSGIIKSTPLALTVTAPPGDFTLSVDPDELTITAGTVDDAVVTVSKTGSFTGPVSLTITGLPDGVTATFDPVNPSPGAESTQDEETTSELSITVGAGVAAGEHPLVIHGTAEGQEERTTTLTLTTAAAPVNGFTLSIEPSALSIEAGQSATATISVHKTGTFNGAVNLSATGLPTGVTVSFNPVTASPAKGATQDVTTTSVVTITVDASVAATEAPIVIHAGAEGQPEATINIALTTTPAPASGFTIAVDPATVTIEAGDDGTSTVTISKTGTFTENVALSVINLPTGVTAAFNPVAASPGKTPGKTPAKTVDVETTSILTLTVENTVAADEYELTVRGEFEGQPDADATLTLTVTPAPGDYTLSLNPSPVSIQAGQNGNATVTISKTGSFTGDVTLSAVGLPANVTASFNPPAASPPRASATRDVETTSVMTLTVGGSVTPTNYPFQVKGVAEGEEDKLLDVSLVVTAPPGPGNSNYKFCDLDNLPIWFAFQNGTGAWTQVPGVTAGDGSVTYTFDLTQSTGGVAFVTGGGSEGFSTSVSYGTQAQLIGGSGTCFVQPPTRTLNGSIAGIDATDNVSIFMGGATGGTANLAAPNFVLDGVLDGASDLLAVRNLLNPVTFTSTPIGMIIRRGLNIANNGTIPVLDFAAGPAEAFAPLAAQITVNNLGGDSPVLTLGYQTPTTTASLSSAFNAPAGPITMYGVPAAEQQGTDLHQLTTFAATVAGDARFRIQWFKTLADMIVALGPPLTVPTVTSLGNAPYPRYSSTGPIQAEYDDVLFLSVTPDGGGDDFSAWTITAFRAYFAGGNYTLLMDDMSAAGYQALWAPAIGEVLNLQTQAVGYSTNGIALPNVDGGFADFASRGVQRTP